MNKETTGSILKIGMIAFLMVMFMALAAAADSDNGSVEIVNESGANDKFDSIQAAINAAEAGDTIVVHEGTYKESLSITKEGLTIQGMDQDNVIIDASDKSGYAISVKASNVSLESFTLIGTGDQTHGYGIKVGPESNGILIYDISVKDSQRTAIDLHGVSDVLVKDVHVFGVASGNGIAVTDSEDIAIDGAVTYSNAWGGIALYTSGNYADVGVRNITIINCLFSNEQNGIYLHDSADAGENAFIDISIIDNTFKNNSIQISTINKDKIPSYVSDINFNDLAEENTFDLSVVVLDEESKIKVPVIFSSIQDAIGAAEAGDTIEVSEGMYNDDLTIDKASLTIRSLSGPAETTIMGATVKIAADDVTIDGFTIDNEGGERVVGPGSTSNTTIKNNVLVNSMRGIQGDWYGIPGDLTILNNVFKTQYGIAGTESMSNLLIEDNTFETSDEGIGLGDGVGIKNIIGNHFTGEGVHIKDYRSDPEMTYIDTLLNENTFDTTVIVQNPEGSIELATIFSSIQVAINEASEGDTIEVASGNYEEVITVDVENITLRSAERHGAVINGTVTIKADNVAVDGFTIRDSEAPVLIEFYGTDGNSILNNRVEVSLNSQAKLAAGNWHGASVGNSTIKNNEFVGAIGLYPKDGAVIEIVNNTVNGAVHEGIWLVPDADVALTIEDNSITDHDRAEENLSEIKIVSRPASINDNTTSGEMKESLLIENSVNSVYLQWATVKDGQSIQGAVDAALPGDTIEVEAGTYGESVSIDKKITLVSVNEHVADPGSISLVSGSDGTTIEGFFFDGSAFCDLGISQAIFLAHDVDNVTIKNNLFVDMPQQAVLTNNIDGFDYNNMQILHNEVSGITSTVAAFQLFRVSDGSVEGNIIDGKYEVGTDYEARSRGIQLDGAKDVTVTGNTIVNVGDQGIQAANSASADGYGDIEIFRNTVENAGAYGERGAIRLYNVDNVMVEKNTLTNSAVGVQVRNTPGQTFDDVVVRNNCIVGNTLGAQNNDNEVTLEATTNWWGHPSGPSGAGHGLGDAVSENVDYRPWLLEAGGERFDFTLVLGQGWNVVSAPSNIEDYEIQGDVAAWLTHTASGWVSDESVISKEFKNPAGAVFVNANETLGVGYNWADFGPGDDFANKQLTEGWNLIGVGNTDDSMNRLSNLKYESGEGITSIYSPNVFNQVKDVSYHWQISQMDKTSWNNGDRMYRLDGYWVYLRGSDRVHSVTVEPAGPASDLVSEVI